MGCPIRKSRDQWIFAPTPGLSQLITSFVASVSQGIRHAPFPVFLRRRPHMQQLRRSLMHRGGRPYFQLYSFYSVVSCLVTTGHSLHARPEAGCGRGSLLTTVLLVSTCQRSTFVSNYRRLAAPIGYSRESVENNGFEPLTPCLQSRCSSQLS